MYIKILSFILLHIRLKNIRLKNICLKNIYSIYSIYDKSYNK